MKKKDFILWLRNRLSDVPAAELDRVCGFYANAIDERTEDGMTEEEAVHALGEPEALLREIRSSLPEQYRLEPGFSEGPPQPGAYAQKGDSWGPRPAAAEKRGSGGRSRLILAAGLMAGLMGLTVIGGFLAWSGIVSRWHWGSRLVFPSPEPEIFYSDILPPMAGTVEATEAYRLDWLGDVARVILRQETGSVLIYPSDGAELSLSSTEAHWEERRETGPDGETVLTLTVIPDSSDFPPQTSLMLPSGDYTLELSLQAVEGEVCSLKLRALEASLQAGTLSLSDVYAKERVAAHVAVGDLNAYSVTALQQVDLSVDTGNLYASLAGSMQDYTVETQVGLGRTQAPENADRASGSVAATLKVDIGELTLSFDDEW